MVRRLSLTEHITAAFEYYVFWILFIRFHLIIVKYNVKIVLL